MGSSRDLVLTCLIGLLLWRAEADPAMTEGMGIQRQVFDVTKNGAVGDGKRDNSKAFTDAWAAACKFNGASTFLIPEGVFLLSSASFSGPCYNQASPRVEIRGKLVATPGVGSGRPWIIFRGLGMLNITGAGKAVLDGKGETTWTPKNCLHSDPNCQMPPTSLQFIGIKSGSLSHLTLLNGKAFHVIIMNTNDFIVHNVKITAPGNSPNTDGVHIGDATGITITNSIIRTGDDCVSIGSGSSNIVVTNIQCGPGHGISVGSLGKIPNEKEVKGLRVKNCTLTGTTNGVRIKTWPASTNNMVSDVRFEDIIMKNVSNPIIIDQNYCDGNCDKSKPSRVKLNGIHYKNINGTSFTTNAVSITCSQGVPCQNVELVNIHLKSTLPGGTVTAVCSNARMVASNVNPSGCK